MVEFTRRESLALGLAAASIPILGAGSAQAAVDDVPTKSVKQLEYKIEKGATLSVLRPAKFVDAGRKILEHQYRRTIPRRPASRSRLTS